MKKQIYFIVCFVVVFSLWGMSEDTDSPRLSWVWTKAEQSGLEFLAAQIKRDAQGFWSHKAGHYTVRSNVSAGLTAQAARYTERMLEILPRLFGFPVVRNGQEFSLTIHKTRAAFKAAAGPDCASFAFHQVLAVAGGRLADVHILADEVDSNRLMQSVDLRMMQRESVRALMELGGAGREVSVFMREGCAYCFESRDLREKVPRRESNMAELAIRSRMLTLQESVMDKNQLCPDLISAWFLPESAFIGRNSELNQALAQSFVDYLLSSAQRYRKLRSLLYIDKSSQQNTAKNLLGMEKSWHDHICRILSDTLYVHEIDIPVCAQPSREPSDINIERWGRRPLVVVSPGDKDTYDIGWQDIRALSMHVLRCGAGNRKLGEITPDFIDDSNRFLGFCSIPGKDLYIAGHSRDNAAGNKDSEFWVAGFNDKGNKVFDTLLFGAEDNKILKSKGDPGGAGTSRIIYNESSDRVAVYCGHTMLWADGKRHQAGYFSLLSLSGVNKMVNGWYVSHNFDQRIVVKDGVFHMLAHGDAYPRALQFSKWAANGQKICSGNFHNIPGESGDNTTHCQVGGLVVTEDNESVVVFASANQRESHDICMKLLDASGKEVKERWLTSYKKGEKGAYPRIAHYGNSVLVAWREDGFNGKVAKLAVLNTKLEFVKKPASFPKNQLPVCYDMLNLSGGSVIWALGGSLENTIRICRIDLPEKMYKMLSGRVVKESRQAESVKRLPKKGYTKQLDAALLKKLVKLGQEEALPEKGMKLSITKAMIRLISVMDDGALKFEAQVGGSKKSAIFLFADLTLSDKSIIAGILADQEPDNQTLSGVAAFYMECAGRKTDARMYYARAGYAETKKFKGFFDVR